MKNTSLSPATRNTVILFWLGLLTGAMIVGYIFLFRLINNVDYRTVQTAAMGTPQLKR